MPFHQSCFGNLLFAGSTTILCYVRQMTLGMHFRPVRETVPAPAPAKDEVGWSLYEVNVCSQTKNTYL